MPALEIITIAFIAAVGSFIGEQTLIAAGRPVPKEQVLVIHGLKVPHKKDAPAYTAVEPSYKGNWSNAGRID